MQEFIVTLIVAAAALYAAWYWMPGSWRRALAARLAGKSGRLDGLARAVGQAPGCGACESCGTCATTGKVGDKKSGEGGSAQSSVVQPPQSLRQGD